MCGEHAIQSQDLKKKKMFPDMQPLTNRALISVQATLPSYIVIVPVDHKLHCTQFWG